MQPIDYDGFQLFMATYLENDIPEELCQHLFTSFKSKTGGCSPAQSRAGTSLLGRLFCVHTVASFNTTDHIIHRIIVHFRFFSCQRMIQCTPARWKLVSCLIHANSLWNNPKSSHNSFETVTSLQNPEYVWILNTIWHKGAKNHPTRIYD